MLYKIFGWGKQKKQVRPAVPMGHYSDNNKTVAKTAKWSDAENYFKEKKYFESISAFFDYMCDDSCRNVVISGKANDFSFEIYQGTKVIRGSGNARHIHAKVLMARMTDPSVPVMRRLLEQNFSFYYCRFSVNRDTICMQFDSDIESANPNKLYYAFKELAVKADREDDLLIRDFPALQKLDSDHLAEMPEDEKETRYRFMIQWIDKTLQEVAEMEADKFPGGISFLLLALVYRIDFLIVPEGALRYELEKVQDIYFKKETISNVEKNRLMVVEIQKIRSKSKEEIFKNLFKTTSTFSARQPKNYSSIAESINNANNSMAWYKENKRAEVARQISEYGISFCQYAYSLPRPLTELFQILMEVNYETYFSALGYSRGFYDENSKSIYADEIEEAINSIVNKWKVKFPRLMFKTREVRHDNLVNFNQSFTSQLAALDFEAAQT